MIFPDISGESADCIHPVLNAEVRAVGGSYTFLRETRMPFGGGEVLYFVGAALMDSMCCGGGGCGYASVRGFIERYRYRQNESGHCVSRVKPIIDPEIRRTIESMIKKREHVQQVIF